MAIVMTANYLAATTVDSWKTRIGYENRARGELITASSEASGTYKQACTSDQTFEWWQSASMPAWWAVEFTSPTTINYVGIAVHGLGANSCTVKVQFYAAGAWHDIAGAEATPSDDKPIMILFEDKTYSQYRIYITGSGAPRIGVIYMGRVLEMDRPVKWMGHVPAYFNRSFEKRPTTSERGQRLGTSIIRQGRQASFDANLISETWMRSTFDDFIVSAQQYGYFISWRPTQFADEVFFGWTEQPIIPENSQGGVTRKMSISWDMNIHVHDEAEYRAWSS